MYSSNATKKEIKYILNNLREEDKQELTAKHGKNFKNIVYKSIRKFDSDCRIGYFDNKNPVLMYGIVSQEIPNRSLGGYKKEYAGAIWMLATKTIDKEQISFLKQAKKYVQENLKNYTALFNCIFKKNTTAIKWLKWLGFEFSEYTEDFLFFYKRKY